MSELQVVVFSLNNEICGVDANNIKQIIKYQDTAKIPKMPEFIEGMTNLRGMAVPVINLNRRLGLGEAEVTKKTKILITEIEEHLIGFMVNDVIELGKFTENEIEKIPDIIQKAGNYYIRSVAKKGEKIISILDLGSILNGEEIKKLEKLNRQ